MHLTIRWKPNVQRSNIFFWNMIKCGNCCSNNMFCPFPKSLQHVVWQMNICLLYICWLCGCLEFTHEGYTSIREAHIVWWYLAGIKSLLWVHVMQHFSHISPLETPNVPKTRPLDSKGTCILLLLLLLHM